jgi:hypothetical protein
MVATGQEITLTPESVDALASPSLPPALIGQQPYLKDMIVPNFDTHNLVVDVLGLNYEAVSIRAPSITISPTSSSSSLMGDRMSPSIVSGVLSNKKIYVPGGLDQYSSMPDVPDEPVPKKILIHYCKSSKLNLSLDFDNSLIIT